MIIGITGDARAGKNEASGVLKFMHGFEEFSFAEPIRQFVIHFLGLSGLEELDKIKDTPHQLFDGKTPRFAMQTLGTEWGRELIYDKIWVNRCIAMAKSVDKAVISDVRFENEAQAIIDAGGKIIKIIRPNNKIKESSHASEGGIDNKYITRIVNNDSNLYNFRKHFLEAYQTINEPVYR